VQGHESTPRGVDQSRPAPDDLVQSHGDLCLICISPWASA
jgi:aminoglycoside phosphotransferase